MAEDKLQSSEVGRTACVAPESPKNVETNFHAFSSDSETKKMDLVPLSVVDMLSDKSDWNKRMLAICDIQSILKQSSDSEISPGNLREVVKLVTISINDSQSKISLRGLQVLEFLVNLVGKRIFPHMSNLTFKILTKIGSNRGDLKKAGMSVFKALMEACGPMQLFTEITRHDYKNRNRVREEAVNVIISIVIYYENKGIDLVQIADKVVSFLTDSKAKVRQAAFEALALVSKNLEEKDLGIVVEKIAHLKPQTYNGFCVMDAFYARLARESFPSIDKNGLVQHSVPVMNPGSQVTYTGADVDWITAPSAYPNHSQLESGPSVPPPPPTNLPTNPPADPILPGGTSQSMTFRPYRSAGKRPWETDEVRQSLRNA